MLVPVADWGGGSERQFSREATVDGGIDGIPHESGGRERYSSREERESMSICEVGGGFPELGNGSEGKVLGIR